VGERRGAPPWCVQGENRNGGGVRSVAPEHAGARGFTKALKNTEALADFPLGFEIHRRVVASSGRRRSRLVVGECFSACALSLFLWCTAVDRLVLGRTPAWRRCRIMRLGGHRSLPGLSCGERDWGQEVEDAHRSSDVRSVVRIWARVISLRYFDLGGSGASVRR
jgi:hypothetical protein